jgi:hypothetical protein
VVVFAGSVLHRGAVPSATAPPTRRQHLSALGLAFLCAVLFLRDGLLPGRALVPYPVELFDVHMAEAIATGTFDPATAYRGNLGMADKYMQSLCWDRVMQDRFAAAELPRWTRDIGGGAPFVPQMAQPWQPINLLLLLLPSEQWYGWWCLVHLVLFGYFAWVFLRRIGCQHASALFGLVAAVLGTWTQCKLHHNVILTAALSVWPMLTAVHDLVTAPGPGAARVRTIGWLGLWTGLSWSSGFVVVSLQATLLTMSWSLFLAARKPRAERLRGLLPVGLGLALGGALAAANMLPILMAAEVAARSAVFDLQRLADHGLEWDHALSLCWPDLLSWAGDRIYEPRPEGPPFQCHARPPWSQLVLFEHPLSPADGSAFHSWVETSFSIGAVGLGCVCLALFDKGRRGAVAFFAAAALVAFGIATADQPFLGLAAIVPGLAKGDLRRLLFVVAMCLVVLSALGADALLCARPRWPMRALLGSVAAASLVAVIWLQQNAEPADFVHAYARLYAADSGHPDVIKLGGSAEAIAAAASAVAAPGEVQQNQHMLALTAWRALITALVAIAASFLRPHKSVLVLTALSAVELLHSGLGPVQTVPARSVATPPKVLQPVLAAPAQNGVRPRLQRLVVGDASNVAALPGNFPAYLGIEDGSAYNPLSPARFEEFFTAIEPDRPGKHNVHHSGSGVGLFHDPMSLGHPLCDLFGIRFVLTRTDVAARQGLEDRTPPDTGGYRLLERTTTLPRATFVREIDVLPDKNERLATLRDWNRDVRHRVVLEDPTCRRPAAMQAGDALVAIDEHRDERVVVTVSTQADGYLRLHDPYDPGWRVSVDGAEQTLYVADHYLRAVYVPPGQHTVVFTYDGARVVWPLRVSLLALVVVVVLLRHGLRRQP